MYFAPNPSTQRNPEDIITHYNSSKSISFFISFIFNFYCIKLFFLSFSMLRFSDFFQLNCSSIIDCVHNLITPNFAHVDTLMNFFLNSSFYLLFQINKEIK